MLNLDKLVPEETLLVNSSNTVRLYLCRWRNHIATETMDEDKIISVWAPQEYQHWTIKEEWVEVTEECFVNDVYVKDLAGYRLIIYHGDLAVNRKNGYKWDGLRVWKRGER
jgi:hypothetical protein